MNKNNPSVEDKLLLSSVFAKSLICIARDNDQNIIKSTKKSLIKNLSKITDSEINESKIDSLVDQLVIIPTSDIDRYVINELYLIESLYDREIQSNPEMLSILIKQIKERERLIVDESIHLSDYFDKIDRYIQHELLSHDDILRDLLSHPRNRALFTVSAKIYTRENIERIQDHLIETNREEILTKGRLSKFFHTRDGGKLTKTKIAKSIELWISDISSNKVDNRALNEKRGMLSNIHYEEPLINETATFIACSLGTGLGKSYGAINSYIKKCLVNGLFHALKNKKTSKIRDLLKNGFTNLHFQTPIKAQFGFNKEQFTTLYLSGVQFTPSIADIDLTNFDFSEWVTGKKNYDLYKEIIDTLSRYDHEDSEIFDSILSCFGRAEKKYKFCKSLKNSKDENVSSFIEEQNEEIKKNLSKLVTYFKKYITEYIKKTQNDIDYIVYNGAASQIAINNITNAEHLSKDEKTKKSLKQKNQLWAVYQLIRRFFPIEVAKHLPCFTIMTAAKSERIHAHLVQKERSRLIDYKPEYNTLPRIMGSKLSTDKFKKEFPDFKVNQIHQFNEFEQIDLIKNILFKIDPDCPFRSRNIRFYAIIDEAHTTLGSLIQNSISNIINDDIFLYHAISSVAGLNNLDDNLASLSSHQVSEESEVLSELIQSFKSLLKETIINDCQFSPGLDPFQFLNNFSNAFGGFTANSRNVERISSIANQLFSFNQKSFMHSHETNKILLIKNNTNSSIELFPAKKGEYCDCDKSELDKTLDCKKCPTCDFDISLTQPNLTDFWNLVMAILITISKFATKFSGQKGYKLFYNYLETGGNASSKSHSNNYNLALLFNKVKGFKDDIIDLIDSPINENTPLTDFFTYFSTKICFSFRPIERYEGVHQTTDSLNDIKFCFFLDIINAAPETLFLETLYGTYNTMLPISATAGYVELYSKNYSIAFLKKWCDILNIEYKERDDNSYLLTEEIVYDRSKNRSISFHILESDDQSNSLNHNWSEDNNPLITVVPQKDIEAKKITFDIQELQLKNRFLEKIFFNPKDYPTGTYKKREILSQLESIFWLAKKGESGLSLSISHSTLKLLSNGILRHKRFFEDNYQLQIILPESTTNGDDLKVFEFNIYNQTIRCVLYDTKLSELVGVDGMKDLCSVHRNNLNIALLSSFGSAGTGLNNVISYVNEHETLLEEDFQNLFFCGSPYYSDIKDDSGNLNTINNYYIVIKNLNDQYAGYTLGDIPSDLSSGFTRDILDEEHANALEKEKNQVLGRTERRDTKIGTIIHIPKENIIQSAFTLKNFPKKHYKNHNIYRGMSLNNKSYTDFSISYMQKNTFPSESERYLFEKETEENGRQIDHAHQYDLNKAIYDARCGDINGMELNDLFRSIECFSNPKKWIKKIKDKSKGMGLINIHATSDDMMINKAGLGDIIICDPNPSFSATSQNKFGLSDYSNGNTVYNPWDVIFPNFPSLDTNEIKIVNSKVKEIIKQINKLKTLAIKSNYIPSKAIIPLLRGNIGEYITKMILEKYNNISILSNDEIVFQLGSGVYECFDFFVSKTERDGTKILIAIDSKYWSVKKPNPYLVNNLVNNSDIYKGKKPLVVINATQKSDIYNGVTFLYLNAGEGISYLENDLNKDNSVCFMNAFIKSHAYINKTTTKKLVNEFTGKESSRNHDSTELEKTFSLHSNLDAIFS